MTTLDDANEALRLMTRVRDGLAVPPPTTPPTTPPPTTPPPTTPPPTTPPPTAGWSLVGAQMVGTGIEPTLTTLGHGVISGGPTTHAWQIRGAGSSTQVEIVWCATGSPVSTGYAVRLSQANITAPWNVSLRAGTATVAPSLIRRLDPNTQRHTGSTSLVGVIPRAEKIQVRVAVIGARVVAAIEWGIDEQLYLELANTTHRGTGVGFTSLTPSGARPLLVPKLNRGAFWLQRPRRLVAPTIVTVSPTSHLQNVPSSTWAPGLTGAGVAHVIDAPGDVIVQQTPGTILTKPLFVNAGGSFRGRGLHMVAAVQPGNDAAGGLKMNDGRPAIRPRLPNAGGLVRIHTPYDTTFEGCILDVAGHSSDVVISRGGAKDADHAFLSQNHDIRFIGCMLGGHRNDNAAAGDGIHGDTVQTQGMVARNVIFDTCEDTNWASSGVLEAVGGFDGLQTLMIRGFDRNRDERFKPGHPMWHDSDDGFGGFIYVDAKTVVFDGPSHWNWPTTSYHHGNFVASGRLYDAAASDPAKGVFAFKGAGMCYLGQGQPIAVPQLIYDKNRSTPLVTVAQLAAFTTSHFDDM